MDTENQKVSINAENECNWKNTNIYLKTTREWANDNFYILWFFKKKVQKFISGWKKMAQLLFLKLSLCLPHNQFEIDLVWLIYNKY